MEWDVNVQNFLSRELCAVPLDLLYSYGTGRQTAKSNLLNEIEIKRYLLPSLREILILKQLLPISCRSSHPELFLGKGVLKICSKFKGEHPCRSAISIKLQSNFTEITLRYGCSPVNLRHIFRTPFLKSTSGRLLMFMGILQSTDYSKFERFLNVADEISAKPL